MKKFLYVFAVLLAFAACTKQLPVVSISAVEEFNAENVAAVTLTLSAASASDVQVLLQGSPADKLSFDETVVIPAGSTSAGLMVRINPEGIDPNAPIQVLIKDAIGAVVGSPAMVTIGLKNYGGNGGDNGDNGGNGGNESSKYTLVPAWTIQMDGDPYTDEYGDWIDLKVVTDGIHYYGVEGITDSEFAKYYESLEDYIQSWEDYIVANLGEYDITDMLFSNGDYTYITYPGEGAGKIYLVEFGADGKATGRYNVVNATFPEFEGGGSLDITATLVPGWSAEMDGDPYTDEWGDWIDLTMTTPGIKYYAVEGMTDKIFDNYYDGIEELIEDWAYEVEDYLDEGYELTDILFADGEYTYIEYPGEGTGKIFIIEFDENGAPTGRYGVSSVTFPEFEGDGGSGGSLDDFKQEIGVPETFTVNTALGASYLGLYHGTQEDMDVFSATGTGESLWYLNIYDAGVFTANDVPAYAAELAADLEAYLADFIEEYGDEFTSYFDDLYDFLAQTALGTYEGEPLGYSAHEAGNYDVLVLTFTDEGDLSGEYNIVTVAVDGHEFQEASEASARRHFPIGKGLGGLRPVSMRHAVRADVHRKVCSIDLSIAAHKSAKKSNKICRLK